MIEKVKHTAKHSIIYTLGNISIKLVGFILLPFYTSHLTTAQYGILAILETTFNILAPLFLLNINGAVIRFFNETDEQKKGSLLFTALVYVLFSGLFLNALLQPFSRKFALLIFGDAGFTVYFKILFINIALQNITFLIRGYFNARQQPFYFSLLNFVRFVIVLGLTIYFIVKLNWGIKGILLAQTISYILTIIIFSPSYLKDVYRQFDRDLLREMLKYSAPLAFSTISSLVLAFGDRYVLKFLMDEAAVGVYSLASKLSNVIDFIVLQGFQLAYLPYAFKNYKSKGFAFFHSRMTTYLIFAMIFLGLAFALFAKEVIYLFSPTNKNYWEAAKYVPYLAFMRTLYGLRFMFAVGLHIHKKTKIVPGIVVTVTVLNIVLNLLFIPHYKIYGAIISSFIALVIMVGAYYYFSFKYFKVKYEFGRMAVVIALALLLALGGSVLSFDSVWVELAAKLLVLLSYPLLLWLVGFFKPEEIESVKGFLRKWGNPANWKSNLKSGLKG